MIIRMGFVDVSSIIESLELNETIEMYSKFKSWTDLRIQWTVDILLLYVQ